MSESNITHFQMLDEVDGIVASALERKDPTIATRYGRFLMDRVRMSGVALASLLYRLQSNWNIFQEAGVDDDFYSVMEAEMGVAPATAKKYSHMWEAIFVKANIPDEWRKRLLCKPIKTLLLLPALADEGNVDWEEIVYTSDKESVRRIVRRIRGDATSSKTALIIRMDVRTGQLTAVRGDGIYEPFGMLAVDKGEKNEVVAHAIRRIVRDAGIQEV